MFNIELTEGNTPALEKPSPEQSWSADSNKNFLQAINKNASSDMLPSLCLTPETVSNPTDLIRPADFEPETVPVLTARELNSLSPSNLGRLSNSIISNIQTGELAKLPTSILTQLTERQIQALTAPQLHALTTTQLNSIILDRVGYSLTLSDSQAAALRPEQIQNLPISLLDPFIGKHATVLSTDQLKALNKEQREKLSSSTLDRFSSEQLRSVAALPNDLIPRSSEFPQILTLLLPGQMCHVSPAQIRAMTQEGRQLISPKQIVALSDDALRALPANELSFPQLRALYEDYSSFHKLSEEQLGSFTQTQIKQMEQVPIARGQYMDFRETLRECRLRLAEESNPLRLSQQRKELEQTLSYVKTKNIATKIKKEDKE